MGRKAHPDYINWSNWQLYYFWVTFFAKTSKPSYWAIFFYNQYGALNKGERYSWVEPTQQWTQQEFYFQTKFSGETASIMFQPLTDQLLYIHDLMTAIIVI